MATSSPFRTFLVSFDSWLKLSLRAISASWFIGLHIIGPIFFITTSWIIASLVGGNVTLDFFAAKSGISDYLAFVTIGFAFQSLVMTSTWNGAHAIRVEQQSGTAESIFLTPSNKLAWLLGRIAAPTVFSLIAVSIVLITGFSLFPFRLQSTPNLPTATIGVLLTLAGMVAFSYMLAGTTFIVKREGDIWQVLWPTMIFLCGLAFPIEILPPWVQLMSYLFPLTHGLDIARRGILLGLPLWEPQITWRILLLVIQFFVYLPIGIYLFRHMLYIAKKTGALSTY